MDDLKNYRAPDAFDMIDSDTAGVLIFVVLIGGIVLADILARFA